MADEQTQEGTGSEETSERSAEDVQREARDMGWQPKEHWKGRPEAWVDAAEFVKKGETFIPFLQHERRKLKTELDGERQARLKIEQELRQTRESVESLTKFREAMAKERTERRKIELGAELRAAREAGDDVRIAELQNELGEVVKKPEATSLPLPRSNGESPPPPQIQPWVKQFLDGNEDFFKNTRKVALFNAVMLEKRQAGDVRVGEVEGTALLTEAREEVERALGGNSRRQAPSKTEESRTTDRGGPPAGNSYASLPREAQEQCDQQEEKFMGPSKAFKNQAAWRKYFVSEYFGPSAITRGRSNE